MKTAIKPYTPRPGSKLAALITYMRRNGGWVSYADAATHLKCGSRYVVARVEGPRRKGVVKLEQRNGVSGISLTKRLVNAASRTHKGGEQPPQVVAPSPPPPAPTRNTKFVGVLEDGRAVIVDGETGTFTELEPAIVRQIVNLAGRP